MNISKVEFVKEIQRRKAEQKRIKQEIAYAITNIREKSVKRALGYHRKG